MIFIAGSSACAVGQERHLPRVLHGRGHVALMLRAVARHAARPNLSPLGDELLEQADVLEIDVVDPVLAEDADLLLLLLLPALVVLLLTGSSLRLRGHPVPTPLPHLRWQPRPARSP